MDTFSYPEWGQKENMLLEADAASSLDVWAVGYSRAGTGPYKTLIERWNGTKWTLTPSPNASNSHNSLTDVEVIQSNSAWAVGHYRQSSVRKTLLMHWNGTSWSVVPSPNPGTVSNVLLDVAAVGSNDIWAVGYKSSGSGYLPLALHYNGTSWSAVSMPTAGSGDNILTSLSAVSPTDVWVAGYYTEGTEHKTLTLHYDGAAWERVPSVNAPDGVTILRGVGAFSSTNAWAVGLEYRANRKQYTASTQRWDGSTWTAVPAAISSASTKKSEMRDVAKAPDTPQIWAVGRPSNIETICPSDTTSALLSESHTKASGEASASRSTRVSSAQTDPTTSQTLAAPLEETVTSTMSVDAVDKAVAAGIAEMTKTHGAIVADFDKNGSPDIFLGRHQGAARLYANDGAGHFIETNKGVFRPTDRHGCDAADVNHDGLQDIFCTVGAALGTQPKSNELYVQRSGNTFVDQAAKYGLLEPFSRGKSGVFLHANADANPDLFVGNEIERADGMPTPNRLFLNQTGAAFHYAPTFGLEREVGDGAPTGGGPDAIDFNKDGWQDLLIETGGSGLRLYRNNSGTGFTDVAKSVGLGQSPKDAIIADVNGDAWPDVVEVTADELSVMINSNGAYSKAFSVPLSFGLAVASGDVNGDARPDIYVMRGNSSAGNEPDQVYLNDGTGRSFSQMASIPSTGQGRAESVFPIDHDGNGLTDFLVLNGNGEAQGPVQLISFTATAG